MLVFVFVFLFIIFEDVMFSLIVVRFFLVLKSLLGVVMFVELIEFILILKFNIIEGEGFVGI